MVDQVRSEGFTPEWVKNLKRNFSRLSLPVQFKDGVLYANTDVDVTISFKEGSTERKNLGGWFKIDDAAYLTPQEIQDLFKDENKNGVMDGIEEGILHPLFADEKHINGRWLEALTPTFYTEKKEVTYPLDIEFLVDTTGSFWDDINNFKAKASQIVSLLKEQSSDVRFALADFKDFPRYPYGGSEDYPFRKDLDFTSDEKAFKTSLNKLHAFGGMDGPEAQLEALYRSIDALSWRKNAIKVIALSTDAPFHDHDKEPAYPGKGYKEVVDALRKHGIEVLALHSGTYGKVDSEKIAKDTGGYYYQLSTDSKEIVEKLKEGLTKIIEEKKVQYEKLTGGETVHLKKGDAIVFYLASGKDYDPINRDSILFSTNKINGILAAKVKRLNPKEYELYWEDSAGLKDGDKDFDDVVLDIKLNGKGLDGISYSTGEEAIIAKRSIVGNNIKTVVFGDKKVEVKIPVLEVTDIVDLKFGKYEGLFPNGTKIDLTVPAEAIHNKLDVKVEGKTETIEIENPGKPEKPSKKEFIDPSTGQLDKTAYKEALAEYKAQLKEYKEALKEFKAAVKEAKLEAKGEVKSLKVEEKAVKKVQKYLDKILKTAKKIDKYIKKAEAALDKAEALREKAKEIRAEAEKRAEALLGSGWTMEQLEAKLQKPKKEDFVDPTTGQLDKEAYNKALAEYKEAKAIYKLFKKADKLELKADKLEAKADKYEAKAKDMAQKSLDKFYKGLEKLLTTYTNKANSLESKAQQLLEKAKELSGANYYKALGKGLYDKELAQGYKRGAELTRAVLETYEKLDITKNPDASTLLKVVDIYKTNFKL